MILCHNCGKEIYFDHEESDLDYDQDNYGNITAKDVIVKIYNHVHSNEHLCDSKQTGACPKKEVD